MYRQIYNKILSHPIITLAIIQLVLIGLVYYPMILHPNDFMFTDIYDGLKNYFTFTQFITQEPSSLGMFHFQQMNYPFGEYVFFSDNTPLLAFPLRFIHLNIINLDGNVVGIHNLMFLVNIFITPLLFYKIIQRYLSKPSLLVILFCIGIAWINPQILKLSAGVYNLSLSAIILLVILLMQSIHNLYNEYQLKKLLRVCIGISCFTFFSAAVHLYYIPLIALPIGVFTFVLFLHYWLRTKQMNLKVFLSVTLSVLLGGFGFFFLLQGIDTYSALRNTVAQGFDWSFWRFTPEAIFTPESYYTIPTPMPSCDASGPIPYESKGFLGNFFWYSFLLFVVSWLYLVLSKKIPLKRLFTKLFISPVFFAFFLTMVISYATASGTYVKFCVIPLGLDNVLSPFYFIHDKIDLITQFRCLGRFSWMGFWLASIFSILVFVKWQKLFLPKHKVMVQITTLALMLILILDIKDAAQYQNTVKQPNLFKGKNLESDFEDLQAINFNDYQAIFTIPATHVGSENYDFTIDDQPEWSSYWMRLSAHSNLPLFNCKMSRTAVVQAEAQIDLLRDQAVPAAILELVNNKPVLVVYNPEMENNYDLKIQEYAQAAVKQGSKIIKAFEMDTLAESNNIYYLRWDIKNKH